MIWFTDGPDQVAIETLLAQFEQTHPDVAITLTLVSYGNLQESLLNRLANNDGPDLARVTVPPPLHEYALDLRPYLSQPSWAEAFIAPSTVLVTGPDGELFGLPHDLTLDAPFVNVSLFEQANVPLPTEDCVSWERWAELAVQVRKANRKRFAMAIDRSGHRLDAFIQSYGGSYFAADGSLNVTSAETKRGLSAFVDLHRQRVISLDVWVSSGDGYVSPDHLFIDNQLPFYLSGNWQVAKFEQEIGDRFAWQAVLNGCETQHGGMPGGKFIMPFEQTDEPEVVTALIEHLGSREAMTRYAQQILSLPTRVDLLTEGIEYPTQNETMNTYLKGVNLLAESAYRDQNHSRFGLTANAMRDEMTNVLIGEQSIDEAVKQVTTIVDGH